MGHSEQPSTHRRGNRLSGEAEDEATETWLAADAGAAAAARQLAGEFAEDLPARAREDLLLVTSELVANAVEHGSGDKVWLRVEVLDGDSQPAVEVAVGNRVGDPDGALPERPWRMPEPTAVRGRGLAIVSNLADEVRVEATESGHPPQTMPVREGVAVEAVAHPEVCICAVVSA